MLSLSGRQAIFAYTAPVDFRKQHDGLVALVRDELETDPFDGSVFVFFNRRRDRIKLLLWDGNGFWLLYKRLENGTYERLRNSDDEARHALRQEHSLPIADELFAWIAATNAAERPLCAVAVGRKNGLYFQTEGGGEMAVVLSSLVKTATAIGLDPRVYLRDVMLRIAHETDAAKLTLHGWREHFQAKVEAERDAALAHFAGV